MNRPSNIRRSSAGTRRHHRTHLPYRLDILAPGVATVLVLPDSAGDTVHSVTAYDAAGRPMAVTDEHAAHILGLLQGAFTADWARPLVWRRNGNTLAAESVLRGAA
ncbi:hypothetical protein [Streptomyces sp. ME19-01-6]|uniref:hypothetical protein n=1 Tax=Streptomyces sp. ME19-01-6 TaxID=3028686 RepID=UPI0029A3A085|nr:hypothetical protein [Streptomyces sp. ME19-01-6]MDX3230540.1 hypothetical protein [Streptomyces sp. ME19-01-6]